MIPDLGFLIGIKVTFTLYFTLILFYYSRVCIDIYTYIPTLQYIYVYEVYFNLLTLKFKLCLPAVIKWKLQVKTIWEIICCDF